MKFLRYGLLIIVMLLGLSFACLNATPVFINYYIDQTKISLSLLLVITFSGGALLGLLASVVKLLRLKKNNTQLSYRLKLADQELAALRMRSFRDNP